MVKKPPPLVNTMPSNPRFKEAVDGLCVGMRYDELAIELDCSVALIKSALRPIASGAFRKPPAGWEVTLRRLLEARAEILHSLAQDLRTREN